MFSKWTFSLLALSAAITGINAATTCNVLKYGAVANNVTDLGPAILKAYSNCVAKTTGATLLIPKGTYLLATNAVLGGSNWIFNLQGTIYIPFHTNLGGTMLQWNNCDKITFTGGGIINGQGSLWRPGGSLTVYPSRPRLLRFQNCNNIDVGHVTLINSPMFHLTVIGNNNVMHDITVTADIIGETDAFDISGNNNYVHDVEVTNGDECVTVKNPTNGFLAENIVCHHSAGCNIGSFGNAATNTTIENVHYKNVTMYNSEAGPQIKTYPNNLGYVRNVVYEDFKLTAISYLIAINLFWCPHITCPAATGTLSISNVSYINIKGTEDGNSRPAVLIHCLPKYPCKNINFNGVSLTSSNGKAIYSTLTNVYGSGWPDLKAG